MALTTSTALTLRNVREKADELIKQIDFKPIDEMQLAEHVGFTDREKQLLKLFWNQAFNESLIYLSDELIRTHLTTEKSGTAIANFIRNKLKKDFEEGVDFFQLDKNDPLVQAHYAKLAIENSASELNSELPESLQNVTNSINIQNTTSKRYFAITAECFKHLLMNSGTKSGKETRNVYIKIEIAAKLMMHYNNLMHQHVQETEKKQIENEAASSKAEVKKAKLVAKKAKADAKKAKEEAEKSEIDAKKAKAEVEEIKQAQLKAKQEAQEANAKAERTALENARLAREAIIKDLANQYQNKRKPLKPEGWIYIVASKTSFKTNMFKIGRTSNLDHRLSTYRTGHQGDDRMEYLYFAEVPNAEIFETLIFHMLQQWRVESATPGAANGSSNSSNNNNHKSDAEVINMPFKSLKFIVDRIVNGNWREAMDYVNRCIETDILITEALEHAKAIADPNLPTHMPIITASRLARDAEEERLRNLPSFTSNADFANPANKIIARQLAERYVNFAYRPTPQCSNAPLANRTDSKHIMPLVAFREFIKSKKLANLPESTSLFNSYITNVLQDHPQIEVKKNRSSNWKPKFTT